MPNTGSVLYGALAVLTIVAHQEVADYNQKRARDQKASGRTPECNILCQVPADCANVMSVTTEKQMRPMSVTLNRMHLSLIAILATVLFSPCRAAEKLLSSGATWKWLKGTAEPSTPPTLWRQANFDDGAWSIATTPLSYGKGETKGTTLTNMQGNYSSIAMRAHFNVPTLHDDDGVTLDFLSDDGFIMWVNGVEMLRYNVAPGELAHDATADFSPDPTQSQSRIITDARAFLKQGDNVVAIQAFNASATSSDFVIDLNLGAFNANNAPPRVISVDPAPGRVDFFDEFTLEFSEGVSGVDPEDIRINGRIPDGVDRLTESKYRFYFQQPPLGKVVVSWSLAPGIVNLTSPAFLFAPEPGKNTVIYQLVDAQEPLVSQVHPAIGTTVVRMHEVSVLFNETVRNVKSSDILINGVAATNVSGIGAGPYLFSVTPTASGKATVAWAPTQTIADTASPSNLFSGGAWTVEVAPSLSRSNLVLNEFLTGNYMTNGLRDEDGLLQDWIEIRNISTGTVSLFNWSLSDDPKDPGKWTFPSRLLEAGQYLLVFASGLDRRPSDPKKSMHTNFRLTRGSGYLGLLSPDSPRLEVSAVPNYPDQRNQISYGRVSSGGWRYFSVPTPGSANGSSDVQGVVQSVHFSEERGVFKDPFRLHLSSPTVNSTILFTTDGNDPLPGRGVEYLGAIDVRTNLLVRAAAYKTGLLPSVTRTKSYLYTTTTNVLSLPVLSLVTDTNNLYGPNGILAIKGGRYVAQGDETFWERVAASDYHNPSQTGIAWERPASFEWIEPLGLYNFQAECGLRTHASLGSRPTLKSDSKFSFRASFRGTYGDSKLNHVLFPNAGAVTGFDNLVLRAGHFDVNPFLTDELTRRLYLNMGHITSHGTFSHLFLNGRHMGYYNPVERLDGNFYRLWHKTTNQFDVVVAYGESREGDQNEWENLLDIARNKDLGTASNYLRVDALLDLDNFADYMLLNIYGDAGDWTDSNWTVYRERTPGSKFRYSVWDAEFSYGIYSRKVENNTLSDPNELGVTTEISTLWNALRKNSEFRLRFADRLHKHMFNEGALADQNILAEYGKLKNQLLPSIPEFSTHIEDTWVPKRRTVMFSFLKDAGLYASDTVPKLKDTGGRVVTGFQASFQTNSASVYYTLDGSDPRQAFNGVVNPAATLYRDGSPIAIRTDLTLKARALANGAWSALLSVPFQVGSPQGPIQLTEVLYNPTGGDAYEFVEIQNSGSTQFDLSGASFEGIDFTFPESSFIPENAVWLIASNADIASFARRYPGITPVGYFNGKLSNSGERLMLASRAGASLFAVAFSDKAGWPAAADGSGPSLEPRNPAAPLDDAANWSASAQAGGTPGEYTRTSTAATVQLNELSTNPGDPWIELSNGAAIELDLAGWSLTDDGNNSRKFIFPASQKLGPSQFLLVQAATAGLALGTSGGSLFLFNPQGARIDAINYGSFPTNFNVGRVASGAWTLTASSTKGSANLEARLAPASSIKLNEWLANGSPGESDWVELFNSSATDPVAVRGLFIQNGAAIAPIADLTFLPPNGYLQLFADEQAAQHHLQMKITAQANKLALLDSTGAVLDTASYPAQTEGASYGRIPDGGLTLGSFTTTQSPGTSNHLKAATGLFVNEIMANNISGIPDPRGRFVDWIEFYNSSITNIDASGFRLEIGRNNLGVWTLPQGALIPAKTYRVIGCDPSTAISATSALPLNSGLSIPKEGGVVRLSDPRGAVLDSIEYGQQVRDLSIGVLGPNWHLLRTPTPGTANSSAATLGRPGALKINEWLANPYQGPDRFEIYNTSALPVALSDLSLSDSARIGARLLFVIPERSYLGSFAVASWEADGDPSKGPGHTALNLDAVGDGIYLYASNGTLINSVSFANQSQDVSQGRNPDGSESIASFTGTISLGSSNYSPVEGLVINEILAHTDPPLDDAIEILNTTGQPINIGNWFISDDPFDLKRFKIPGGETVPGRGFKVLYQSVLVGGQFSSTRFALDSAVGDTLIISEANAGGELTGRRLQVTFGASAHGVSFGRVETSQGADFLPLHKATFGVDSPTSVELFQKGLGAPNASPIIGPVVVTEIHYNPSFLLSGASGASVSAEFIEIQNATDSALDLFGESHPENPWRLANAVGLTFAASTRLAAKEICLAVPFNPAADPQALASFRAAYSVPANTRFFGPYEGKLDAAGETLELLRPDFPQGPNDEHPGLIPYVLVEKIAYTPTVPWPIDASGTGLSIQRQSTGTYANHPSNWISASPTPGIVPTALGPIDSDGDGLPDDWELRYGLDPANPNDATLDADGDGLGNRAEFISGTNPIDASDKLALRVSLVDGSVILELDAKAGKSYSVLVATDLGAGPWTKIGNFSGFAADQTVQIPVAADPTTPPTTRFYRAVTPPAP